MDGEADPRTIVGSKREELPALPQVGEKLEEEEKEKEKEKEKEQEEEEEKPRATVEETIRRLEPSVEASSVGSCCLMPILYRPYIPYVYQSSYIAQQ